MTICYMDNFLAINTKLSLPQCLNFLIMQTEDLSFLSAMNAM